MDRIEHIQKIFRKELLDLLRETIKWKVVDLICYSGVPNRSADTYTVFCLRLELNEKFLTGCSKFMH